MMNLNCFDKCSDWGPFFLRLVAGVIFVWAGASKLMQVLGMRENMVVGMFDAMGIPAALTMVWLVGIVEVIGGIMFLIGWNIRWAALPLAIAMLVAVIATTMMNGFLDMGTWNAWYALAISAYLLVSGAGPRALDK